MTSPEIVERIHELLVLLGEGDYKHRTASEFLELLEYGEDWCKKMRGFLNDS